MSIKINEDFYIKSKIYESKFCIIYKVIHQDTNNQYLMKIVLFDNIRKKVLDYEYKVLKILMNNSNKFPKPIDSGKQSKFYFTIQQLLGPNLNYFLSNLINKKFDLRTVLNIGKQMILILKKLHSKKIIHRNIKPNNICTGMGININNIYLVDFYYAKKIIEKNGTQILMSQKDNYFGEELFISINKHYGYEVSMRDDLEELMYVLIYLFNGNLPWSKYSKYKPNKFIDDNEIDDNIKNIKNKDDYKNIHYNKINNFQNILKSKIETEINIICKNLPKQFQLLLKYTRNLKYEEIPNYNWMILIINNILKNNKLNKNNIFEWLD